MFFILLANLKFKGLVKLVMRSTIAALCGIWLSASPLQADEYGSFDESGNYQHYNSPNSLRPSIGQDGYEQLRQQQELRENQANQEQLRRYHCTPEEPTWRDRNPDPTYFYTPKGMVTCQPTVNNSVICQ